MKASFYFASNAIAFEASENLKHTNWPICFRSQGKQAGKKHPQIHFFLKKFISSTSI